MNAPLSLTWLWVWLIGIPICALVSAIARAIVLRTTEGRARFAVHSESDVGERIGLAAAQGLIVGMLWPISLPLLGAYVVLMRIARVPATAPTPAELPPAAVADSLTYREPRP